MSTLVSAREAIYQRFVDQWGGSSAFTFDNEQFDPPAGVPWVRVSVRHSFGAQETLGGAPNRRFSRGGLIFVQVFVPLDSGNKAADALAQSARAIFEGTHFATDVRCSDVTVREVGPSEGWFQTNVECSFEYDQQL